MQNNDNSVMIIQFIKLDVLEYIHSRGYVHADIKGANILLGMQKGTENQAYLVDFGLATRVTDKEFKPDPKSAHNGTIEYTSRDAHLGVPTMRGDLEILGYNMIQWLVGELPWEKNLKQPKTVQDMKETFMKNVRSNITKQYSNIPDALIKFLEYVNTLKPKDIPAYTKCRQFLENYLKSEGKTRTSKLDFSSAKKGKAVKPTVDNNKNSNDQDEVDSTQKRKMNGEAPKVKTGRKQKETVPESDDCENEEPGDEASIDEPKIVKRKNKRKSTEPAVVVKVKKTKLAPKATPPAKKNHVNMATQTSAGRPKRSPRQVTFDSPICEIIGEKKPLKTSKDNDSVNSSGDIFEDSFMIEEKKIKPKKKLLSDEEVTVKRVVKRKVTTVKPKGKSWKDSATIVNGRSPPK